MMTLKFILCKNIGKRNRSNTIFSLALNLFVLIFMAFFLFSCSVKHVEMPSYEGVDIKDIIAERSKIKSVEAVFSVEFEKGNNLTTGEAAVDITEKVLDMRIYSSGFLVGEVKEENGAIKSKPELGASRSAFLVYGLRNSIFWWNIKDFKVIESDSSCQLKNSAQKIFIDKKTMLPTQQTIELNDGKELRIYYEEPENSKDVWYPSSMKIEFLNYVVRLHIKRISFILFPGQDQQQPSL
jgi:hypothetical protein